MTSEYYQDLFKALALVVIVICMAAAPAQGKQYLPHVGELAEGLSQQKGLLGAEPSGSCLEEGTHYLMQELPVPSGANPYCDVGDINDYGVVVGSCQNEHQVARAVAWIDGKRIPLQDPHGTTVSLVNSVNIYGMAVGNENSTQVVWDFDTAYPLSDFPGDLKAINDNALSVGWVMEGERYKGVAFDWDQRIDIKAPSGYPHNFPRAVNNAHVPVVVGHAWDESFDTAKAFAWDSRRGTRTLNSAVDSVISAAVAINDSGTAVGYYFRDFDQDPVGLVWNAKGEIVRINTYTPSDINNRGVVVGAENSIVPFAKKGIVDEGSGGRFLDHLILNMPSEPITITRAIAINNHGDIAAIGKGTSGMTQERPYLLKAIRCGK